MAAAAEAKDWRPWIVWGLGALFFAYAFFQRVAPSVMADHLMAELALSGAAVGNLSAIYFYSYAGLQIPVGLMVDRYGPRRLMALGTLACAGGAALFGLSKSEEMALIGRLLVGSGAAFSFVAAITLAARWFPATRFAQFTGLTMMVGMAGGLLGQAPLGLAVESFGWRSALFVSALLGLFIALAIWLKVRDFPDEVPLEERAKPGPILAALFRVLRRPKNLMLSVIALALSAPNLGFAGFWAVPWLMQTEGLDRAQAGATASLMLIGWAFGAPCGGWLSDRLGRRKPVILLGLVLGIAAMTVLLFVPGLPRPLFWACFFSAGAAGGCMSALYALLRNVNPASEIGAAFGLVNGANVAAGAVFQPMIGFILDRLWDGREIQGVRIFSGEAYQMALASIPAFMGIALILALFLKEKKTP